MLLTLLQSVSGIPPASVYYQQVGDGKRRKRKHRQTVRLFDEMEATLRALVFGEEPAPTVHAEVAPALDLSRGYGPALDQLLATAGEYEELSHRVTALRADIAAYQKDRALDADEEEWLMWL